MEKIIVKNSKINMILFQDIIRDWWHGDSNISVHHAKSYRQVPHSLEWNYRIFFAGHHRRTQCRDEPVNGIWDLAAYCVQPACYKMT